MRAVLDRTLITGREASWNGEHAWCLREVRTAWATTGFNMDHIYTRRKLPALKEKATLQVSAWFGHKACLAKNVNIRACCPVKVGK